MTTSVVPVVESRALRSTLKLAVVFHRLGPYHHARLRAAAAGGTLVAIEQSGRDHVYAWDTVDGADGFERVTLFPDVDTRDLPAGVLERRMGAALDAAQPDVVGVVSWSAPGALAALGWCIRRRRPAVMLTSSQYLDAPRAAWKEALKARVLALCGAALVGGVRQVDYLTRLGFAPDSVFKGYNVVDNAFFASRAAAARANAPAIRRRLELPLRYFLCVSRLVELKNHHALLAAFARYRAAVGDASWHLVLLGDGSARARILEAITHLGLADVVHLPGFKQYDELPPYYALAGACVLPSLIETWGLVVNEAMACGIPALVSNRCGCAPELIVEGVTGFTFDPADVPALGELLGRVAGAQTDPAALGIAAARRIARFGPDAFAAGLWRAAEAAAVSGWRRPVPFSGLLLRLLARFGPRERLGA